MTKGLAPTPDFYEYPWCPLATAELSGAMVTVSWGDGQHLDCYALWLAENGWGYGIEPLTRESMIDPADLPEPTALMSARIDTEGALLLRWDDGRTTIVHPGWLRHIADGQSAPDAYLPPVVPWTAADMPEPATIDAGEWPHDAGELGSSDGFRAALEHLCRYGLVRLINTPTDDDFVERFARQVGPIRGSNFGDVFTVASVRQPDSTANTGLELGMHADLPTRETPPGVQILHCVESTVTGGASRMTDGLALVRALQAEHPEAYEALTTLEWTFFNRSPDADHRWTGPMIDLPTPTAPLTLRAFYPVRAFPAMDSADVSRSYAAMRLFSELARSDRFMVRFPFTEGVLVAFDNRRVLHGRDGFDPTAGARRLRGCYLDHDDLFSRVRVLARRADTPERRIPQ